MIKSTAMLSFLLGGFTLLASSQWRMPPICDEYDPSAQKSPKKHPPTERAVEPIVTIYVTSLKDTIAQSDTTYDPQNSKTEETPTAITTPMRMDLSTELSSLRTSMAAISYSPSEHASVWEQATMPLNNSVIAQIDTIADTIFEEWIQAEKHIENAELFLTKTSMAWEKQHHYRLKGIILGLNTLYKYRKIIIQNESKKVQEHHVTMLELLVKARISHAISIPMHSFCTRKKNLYKKVDDQSNIQTIYNKLNIKLCPSTPQNAYGTIAFSIDESNSISQSALNLPTQPIAIPQS